MSQTKNRTQSFNTGSKPKNERDIRKSQVSFSPAPEKSEKRMTINQYAKANQKRFSRKSLMKEDKFDPRMYVTNELSIQDVIDLKEVFDTYDSTDMGVLLPNDIKLLLQQNGFDPNKKTVYEIVAEFDLEETGGISFRDFMTAMETKPHINETKKEIASIFKKYDRAGKGFIDIEDIREVNRHVKQNLDEEALQLLLKRADNSESNKITFEDFYSIMIKRIY